MFSSSPFHLQKSSIWDKCIWQVNGSLIVLREWDNNLTIQELEFNFSTLWVQAHGLHFASIGAPSAEKFTNLIGNLIQVDNNVEEQLVNKNYLCFRVDLNVHEPLYLCVKILQTINPMAPYE